MLLGPGWRSTARLRKSCPCAQSSTSLPHARARVHNVMCMGTTSPCRVWPLARLQACLVGDALWVFGGEDGGRRALADVAVLDLPSLTWSTPQVR